MNHRPRSTLTERRATCPALRLALAGILCALAAGCEPPPADYGEAADRSAVDRELVRGVFERAERTAAVTERAVYPHHFEAGSARLNELGLRHLAMLAGAYADAVDEGGAAGAAGEGEAGPGDLVVRRGDAPARLYEARVRTVREALAAAGAEAGRVRISDGLPGGDGTPSVEATAALDAGRGDRPPPSSPGGRAGGGTSSGSGAGGGKAGAPSPNSGGR